MPGPLRVELLNWSPHPSSFYEASPRQASDIRSSIEVRTVWLLSPVRYSLSTPFLQAKEQGRETAACLLPIACDFDAASRCLAASKPAYRFEAYLAICVPCCFATYCHDFTSKPSLRHRSLMRRRALHCFEAFATSRLESCPTPDPALHVSASL